MTTKKTIESQTSSRNPKKSRKSAAAKTEAVPVEAIQVQPVRAEAGDPEMRTGDPVSSDTDVIPVAEKALEADPPSRFRRIVSARWRRRCGFWARPVRT
jgi:hypothetical protein